MAVTKEQARVAIVTKIKALHTAWAGSFTLKVEYDNINAINFSTQTDPFLCVEIFNIDGYQASLAASPIQRVMGSIILTAKAKDGQGIKGINEILDYFYVPMHMSDSMVPVRTHAAKLVTLRKEQGWCSEAAVIPFWYDN